jgi:hypothetical protein
VLIFDRVDFLLDEDNQNLENFLHLWLPKEFPSNIQCILSCSSKSQNINLSLNRNFPVIRFDHKIYKLFHDKVLFQQITNNFESLSYNHSKFQLKNLRLVSIDESNPLQQNINTPISFRESQIRLLNIALEFGFVNYNILESSAEISFQEIQFEESIFFKTFIFSKLILNPKMTIPLSSFSSKKEWLLHQFHLLCVDKISFDRLRDILYFLKLSCCGLSIEDLSQLTSISFSKLDLIIDFLSPLLIKTNHGFLLSSSFLLKIDLKITSHQTLNNIFVKYLSKHQNKLSKLFELANFYMNDAQFFSLKQTLSKINNFLLLFNFPTKYSLFK